MFLRHRDTHSGVDGAKCKKLRPTSWALVVPTWLAAQFFKHVMGALATFAICSAAAVLFFFYLRARNDPATHGKGRVGKLNAYTLRYTITRYVS